MSRSSCLVMKSFSENLDHVPIEGPTRQSRCDRARSKRKRKEKEKKRKERPDNWRKSNDSLSKKKRGCQERKLRGRRKKNHQTKTEKRRLARQQQTTAAHNKRHPPDSLRLRRCAQKKNDFFPSLRGHARTPASSELPP